MSQAKIAMQNGPFSMSAEGSEAFVREVLEKWESLALKPQAASDPATPANSGIMDPAPPKATGGVSIDSFENVFDRVDGKLKIIAQMPGSSKADKARATALVCLFGHYLEGSEQIPSEIIRDACTDQGCFDSTNFSKHLKSLDEKVVMNTKSGGSYDVKLTAPGRKAAKELVEEING